EPVLKEDRLVRAALPQEGEKEPEEKPDKSMFNLFRPTPKELMREMATDRPDQTESTYTLDAGHFQIETTIFGFTMDDRNPERVSRRVREYEIMNTNYKVGLFNNVDFQVVVPSFTVVRTRENRHTETRQ